MYLIVAMIEEAIASQNSRENVLGLLPVPKLHKELSKLHSLCLYVLLNHNTHLTSEESSCPKLLHDEQYTKSAI